MAKGHRSKLREQEMSRRTPDHLQPFLCKSFCSEACFVLDAIRGKDVATALGIVTYNPRYASSLIKKLLESAVANAENNNGMRQVTFT